jgi:hypothetical protein
MEPDRRVTLGLIAAAAAWLFRLRGIFVVLATAAAIWFGLAIANPATESASALVPLSLFLWSLLALGIGYLLPTLPPAIAPDDGLWIRTRKGFVLLAYGMAVVVSFGLCIFAVILSLRALKLSGG